MNFSTMTAVACSAAALLYASPACADHGAAGAGATTSGPIVGSSARTLAKGRLALSIEAVVAEPDNRSDATLAALAGRHIHAHDQASGQVYTLGASAGITDDLTLSLALPFVRRVAIREGEHAHTPGGTINSVVARGDSTGFGDATVVAKWRFTGENHHGWEAAAIVGLSLPTGATHEIDDAGERFETEHQPGSGSWNPLIGLALTRPLPSGGLNASVVYQRSTGGSQQTRLGDRAQATVGLVRRLIGQKIDYHPDDHNHGAQAGGDRPGATLDGVLELSGEWEGREREGGTIDRASGGQALFLSPGLRFNTADWSFTLGVGLPLAQDIRLSHSNTSHRLRFGVSRGF